MIDYIFLIILLGFLIPVSFIDIKSLRIPNILTLPLMVMGLIQAHIIGDDVRDAILGAILGYSAFVIVELTFKYVRGVDGLGRGDAKLLAGGGAWCGWLWLPQIVLIGSIFAIIAIIFMRKSNYLISKKMAIPFGPFLAVAILLVWSAQTFYF